MKNIELVARIFNLLAEMNVSEVMICAGARNAPLVNALENSNFKIFSFFEERSAAFFSLGRSKSLQQPVAIMTTSGTAAAELLPAVIEAYYQGIPLVVITADRPKSYRAKGAPQSIEQVGIFSHYVEKTVDWDVTQKDFDWSWSKSKPVHLNLCFDEPLIDGDLSQVPLFKMTYVQQENKFGALSLPHLTKPFVIVGEIDPEDRDIVYQFLKKNKLYHYAEFLSGLHQHTELMKQQILSSDREVEKLFANQQFESVVRIGGVPTLRFWRDLEFQYNHIPVVSFSRKSFSGLSRTSDLFELSQLSDLKLPDVSAPLNLQSVLHIDQQLQAEKNNLYRCFPLSEQNYVHVLSQIISQKALYIGNSLPIREWDLFSAVAQKDQKTYANRGANGIDGQVATYLGWSEGFDESWCLLGDLTALYDLAALGLTSQLSVSCRRLVVMNNSGGQIFSRVFGNKKFLNEHQVSFKGWAEMWGWNYQIIREPEQLLRSEGAKNLIIEIKPDSIQSQNFWSEWDQLCKTL